MPRQVDLKGWLVLCRYGKISSEGYRPGDPGKVSETEGSCNSVISRNNVYFLHVKLLTSLAHSYLSNTNKSTLTFYLKTRQCTGKKNVGENRPSVCSSHKAN